MATRNLTLTHAWKLAVSSTETAMLVTNGNADTWIEIATTAGDTDPPTVTGHQLEPGTGITRALLPTGAVWVRLAENRQSAGGLLIVDAS